MWRACTAPTPRPCPCPSPLHLPLPLAEPQPTAPTTPPTPTPPTIPTTHTPSLPPSRPPRPSPSRPCSRPPATDESFPPLLAHPSGQALSQSLSLLAQALSGQALLLDTLSLRKDTHYQVSEPPLPSSLLSLFSFPLFFPSSLPPFLPPTLLTPHRNHVLTPLPSPITLLSPYPPDPPPCPLALPP